MAKQLIPFVSNHFRICFAGPTQASIWTRVLVTDGDLETHQNVWNTLASCSFGLMCRCWIVLVWRSRQGAFLKNGLLVAYAFKHL